MKDLLAGILGLSFVIYIFIAMLTVGLGTTEILWWIITGDFFHFVNTTPAVVSTF